MRAIIAISILALLAAGAGPERPTGGRSARRVVAPGPDRPSRSRAAAEARLFFSGGSEYKHQAGCGNFGGFYGWTAASYRVQQRDPVRIGKCPNRASARLETALAGFIAQAASYELSPDGSLRIVARRPDRAVPPAAAAIPARPGLAGGERSPRQRAVRPPLANAFPGRLAERRSGCTNIAPAQGGRVRLSS